MFCILTTDAHECEFCFTLNRQVVNLKTNNEYLTSWLSKVISNTYSHEEQCFRKIESTANKQTKAEQHAKFNAQCIQHVL